MAADCGADYIGFVFAPSKRRINPEAVCSIAAVVPNMQKVGVFVNAPLPEVRDIAQRCRLDLIQLSGDEPPEYCASLGYPVIKAARVAASGIIPDIANYRVSWLLLDTYMPGSYGGTGQTFDWRLAAAVINARPAAPVIVAGGLNPENVGEAISQIRPQGIDVSGGVETDGKKDLDKIARFIKNARAAERRLTDA